MANNRMFLMHVPTKTAVMIGKHMGWGWYFSSDKIADALEEIYHFSSVHSDSYNEHDNFKIILESDPSWNYGKIIEGYKYLWRVEEK